LANDFKFFKEISSDSFFFLQMVAGALGVGDIAVLHVAGVPVTDTATAINHLLVMVETTVRGTATNLFHVKQTLVHKVISFNHFYLLVRTPAVNCVLTENC
jgi:hypothetical protein